MFRICMYVFLTWLFFSMKGFIEVFRVWVKILEFAGMLFYLFESFKQMGCARSPYYTLLILDKINLKISDKYAALSFIHGKI